jgi:glucose/arabinose dehydrogenase
VLAAAPRAGALGLQPIGDFNQPNFMTSPPGDSRLFVVERPGYVQVVHDGVISRFLDIHGMVDSTNGERGFNSIAFDPNYASNGLFYVDFVDNGTGGAAHGDIHVDEYHVSSNPNVADPASRRPVMTINHTSAPLHNGGQLQFGKDGLLYISVGDALNGDNARTLENPLGKILRIDPHGIGAGAHGIPDSNPFLASPAPEIWSLGLRNPWRFSFDHLTGDLVIADVGETEREEIDVAPVSTGLGRGANFGWPCREGSIAGPTSCGGSFTDPVFDYPHSDPGGGQAFGCAIIGGYVYRGTQIPELVGRYVYTDLCQGELRSIQLGIPLAGGDRAESAPGALDRPHSFGEDSSCELYVTNGNAVDKIVGSTPASVPPACPATPSAKKKCKKHKRHKKHRASSAKKKHKKKHCKKKRKKKQRVGGDNP